MEKLKAFIKKYYEGFAYLFFGGLATLLNLVLFAVFQAVLGTGFATGIGNVLDNIICILFAYWTNRTFVFRSKNSGQAGGVWPVCGLPYWHHGHGPGHHLAGRQRAGTACGICRSQR